MTESPQALQASKRIDVDPTGSTCRSDRIADMSRRISYWRGSTRLRVTTVEDATQDEVASFLQRLAAKQLELDYLRASEADTPESPEIRTNRHGAKLWTIGKDFHYTVEWFASGTPTSRSGIGDYPKPTAGELTRRAGRARWIGIPFSVAPADCEARRDTELITCTKLAQKRRGRWHQSISSGFSESILL